MDTYHFAKDVDLQQYSVLCVCGGDGSYHEAVNGMLNRTDKVQIPVINLPNGSGNNLCKGLGIFTLDDGLNYIVRGQCIKIDTCKVLLDHDSEATLPEGDERINYCRYMMNATGLGAPPRISKAALPFKKCCGTGSYAFASMIIACKGGFDPELFDLYIDGEQVQPSDGENGSISTSLMMMFNGKFTGGGIIFDPFALMNDGLLDMAWICDPKVNSMKGIAGILGDAKKRGGI